MKNEKSSNISATALHRFIPQPASGRSSALPCLAANIVLSKFLWEIHLHSLFFIPGIEGQAAEKELSFLEVLAAMGLDLENWHFLYPSSAFLILTARYSFVGRSILKRPLKLPTFSTVMFHVSIMSTAYILLSSI